MKNWIRWKQRNLLQAMVIWSKECVKRWWLYRYHTIVTRIETTQRIRLKEVWCDISTKWDCGTKCLEPSIKYIWVMRLLVLGLQEGAGLQYRLAIAKVWSREYIKHKLTTVAEYFKGISSYLSSLYGPWKRLNCRCCYCTGVSGCY